MEESQSSDLLSDSSEKEYNLRDEYLDWSWRMLSKNSSNPQLPNLGFWEETSSDVTKIRGISVLSYSNGPHYFGKDSNLSKNKEERSEKEEEKNSCSGSFRSQRKTYYEMEADKYQNGKFQ
jgi:hypothetical protein